MFQEGSLIRFKGVAPLFFCVRVIRKKGTMQTSRSSDKRPVVCRKPNPSQYLTTSMGKCIEESAGNFVDCASCAQDELAHGIRQTRMLNYKRTCEGAWSIAFVCFILLAVDICWAIGVQLAFSNKDPNPLTQNLKNTANSGGFYNGLMPDLIATLVVGYPKVCDVQSGTPVGYERCGLTPTMDEETKFLAKCQGALLIVFAVGLFASILYLSTRGSYYDILQGDQRLTVPSKSTPKSSSTPAPSSNIQASTIQGGGKRGGGKPHPNLFCNLI